MRLVRGENCASLDVVELVHARADDPAEVLAEEDLVLHVGADLGAVVAGGRDRQVEEVLPEVAAVGQHVVRAERRDVADLEVEGLALEVEPEQLAVGP